MDYKSEFLQVSTYGPAAIYMELKALDFTEFKFSNIGGYKTVNLTIPAVIYLVPSGIVIIRIVRIPIFCEP